VDAAQHTHVARLLDGHLHGAYALLVQLRKAERTHFDNKTNRRRLHVCAQRQEQGLPVAILAEKRGFLAQRMAAHRRRDA